MKMRNRLEIEAFRFVNKTGIKNLTVDELIKAVEKMECAVIELDDEKQSVLLGKTDKEDKFYLFNNGILKYIAFPSFLDEQQRLNTLLLAASELYISENYLLNKDKNITVEIFAQKLKEILQNKTARSHILRHAFEYVSVICVAVVVLCFSFVAFFLEKNLDKDVRLPEFEETKVFSDYESDKIKDVVEDTIEVLNNVDFSGNDKIGIVKSVDDALSVDNEDILEYEITPAFYDNNTVYYVTKSGTKYHIETCSYIKDLQECKPVKLSDIGEEYTPCKRCIK